MYESVFPDLDAYLTSVNHVEGYLQQADALNQVFDQKIDGLNIEDYYGEGEHLRNLSINEYKKARGTQLNNAKFGVPSDADPAKSYYISGKDIINAYNTMVNNPDDKNMQALVKQHNLPTNITSLYDIPQEFRSGNLYGGVAGTSAPNQALHALFNYVAFNSREQGHDVYHGNFMDFGQYTPADSQDNDSQYSYNQAVEEWASLLNSDLDDVEEKYNEAFVGKDVPIETFIL